VRGHVPYAGKLGRPMRSFIEGDPQIIFREFVDVD